MKELTVKGVFRNGLISVFFQGFPVLTALIFVPLNIKYIGDALWGLYSLTITILFLFMYFNIGINPSVNKKLSALFGVNSEKSNIQELLSNGFYFNLVSALVIGGGMILLSPLIVDLSVGDSEYNNEAVSLFRLSGIVGIFSLLISFFRNVYEAKQNFILVSSLRAILSSTILIAPSFGYLIGLNIVQSFYLVLIVYALAFIFYFWIYFKDFGFPNIEYINKDVFKSLLYFGIWITGHSLINPIFIFLDRFFISKSLGLADVAFYTTPYDLVSKMTLISGSITSAFFPAISYWYAKKDVTNLVNSFRTTLKYLFLGMLLISIILIIIAPLFLKIWINDEYMLKSTGVFRILVVGYFLTSLSLVFLRFIYGIGIPKKAFILNLLLVPIYIALLVVLVNRFGIEGAAWAFMLKSFLDLIFLFKILNKKIKVFK